MPNTWDVHRKPNRWELVSSQGTCPQKQKLWMCWKYHLCQFRAFLKTHCMCIRLPANLVPFVLSKAQRWIVSAHARTFKRGLKPRILLNGDHRWWDSCVGMTQKPSNSHLGGGAHHLPCPRERYICSNAVSMLIGFLKLEELYIMNLFHKNRV
jgi:hypothetical protein